MFKRIYQPFVFLKDTNRRYIISLKRIYSPEESFDLETLMKVLNLKNLIYISIFYYNKDI